MLDSRQLSELSVFKEFYRLIRRLFGLDIALLAPDGTHGALLGQGRELNPFCTAINQHPEGHKRCLDCDSAHARKATSKRQPTRYVCHAGLTEFIIPIILDQTVVAHLQCGQVVNRAVTDADWKKVCRLLSWIRCNMGTLKKHYLESPVMPPEKQKDLIALLRLFAHHAATAHAQRHLLEQDPRDRAVYKAQEFVKNNFRENIRISQVSAAAGVSTRNLTRLLQARTGSSLIEHLHRLRIAQACSLLQQTHTKITAVALDCGFGSIQQFNRVFRKNMGETPSRWRAKARR